MTLTGTTAATAAERLTALVVELHAAAGVRPTLEAALRVTSRFTGRQAVGIELTASTDRPAMTLGTPAGAERLHRRELPLLLGEQTIGALVLYDAEPSATAVGDPQSNGRSADTTEDESLLVLLARHTAVAVDRAIHEEELEHAVQGHKLVGQVTGMVMERFGLSSEQALAFLYDEARKTGGSLQQAAARIADGQLPDVRFADRDAADSPPAAEA